MCLLATVVGNAVARTKELDPIRRTVRGFSSIDSAYIEPQHYIFTVMAQGTYNYDLYLLKGAGGHSLELSPDVTMRVGPYLGWRWIFLGYTFDLKKLSFLSDGEKSEVEFSLYSPQVGVDLLYRKTGSDYKIRKAELGPDVDPKVMEGVPFDGVNVSIFGLNAYYIFNHKRFSYPAAFSQSTCQKLSQGSWMAGAGFIKNSIDFDYDKLYSIAAERMHVDEVERDSGLMYRKVKYLDINGTVGYAYNWVPARNLLVSAGLSAALSYKHSSAGPSSDDGFRLNNFSLDGIGRFGVVYNNTHQYAGISAVLHAYDYHKKGFASTNIFGNVNIYVGVNFGVKKRYRKTKTPN